MTTTQVEQKARELLEQAGKSTQHFGYSLATLTLLIQKADALDWLERIDHQKYLFNNWIGGGGTLLSAINRARREQ